MKITLIALTLAFLVGAAQAQEPGPLPCAPWRAIDAASEPTTLLGEAARRQLIDEALGHVQRLHVDPEFDGVDLEELRQAFTPRIEAARYDHEVTALIEEMLAWVDTYYLSREELQALRARAGFTGVGIQVSILSDGHVLGINYVYVGSPAEAAGLARGDRIIGVDQHSACPHPNHIRGPAGTDVTLTVTSPGQAPRRVTMTRAAIEPIAPPRALRLDEPGIGYLWPGDIGAPGQPAAIRAALEEIGAFGPTDPLDALVLDLRGAIGQYESVDSIRSLAGLFTDGVLLHLIERSSRNLVTAMVQPSSLEGIALVVLVDTASDGLTGMLAAAMQGRIRAQIVGQPVQSAWRLYRSSPLQDGSEVDVPFSEIELLDGTRLRQSGLVPDRVMTVDWRDYPEREDPYVVEAIRLIRTGGIGAD